MVFLENRNDKDVFIIRSSSLNFSFFKFFRQMTMLSKSFAASNSFSLIFKILKATL